MLTYISQMLSLSVTLVAAVSAPQNLGRLVYVAIKGAVAISGAYTTVSSTADVAVLLAATKISAQAAADLNAMFQQPTPPNIISVATYDSATEDPSDALDTAAANVRIGVIAQESRTDANNSFVGVWLNANTDRRWRMVAVLQSATAGLITSGKPGTLTSCEVPTLILHYHGTSTVPSAAAHAGQIAGHSMARAPLPMHVVLLGVTPPTLTSAELAFAIDNDVCVVLPGGDGTSASQRVQVQTRTYDGSEGAPVFSMVYAANSMIAALQAMLLSMAGLVQILRADAQGAGTVTAALDTPLAAMAGTTPQSHFLPGVVGSGASEVPLSKGYGITTTPVGTELNADVVLRFGPEATHINLSETGIIVVES